MTCVAEPRAAGRVPARVALRRVTSRTRPRRRRGAAGTVTVTVLSSSESGRLGPDTRRLRVEMTPPSHRRLAGAGDDFTDFKFEVRVGARSRWPRPAAAPGPGPRHGLRRRRAGRRLTRRVTLAALATPGAGPPAGGPALTFAAASGLRPSSVMSPAASDFWTL